eukprot:515324-Amphidinium_carterae.1
MPTAIRKVVQFVVASCRHSKPLWLFAEMLLDFFDVRPFGIGAWLLCRRQRYQWTLVDVNHFERRGFGKMLLQNAIREQFWVLHMKSLALTHQQTYTTCYPMYGNQNPKPYLLPNEWQLKSQHSPVSCQ